MELLHVHEDAPELQWVKAYQEHGVRRQGIPDKQCVTDDPMMHAYIHVKLWAKAVEKAGSTDVDKVLKALEGLEIDSPVGKYKVDEKNHHTWKPVYIGKIREDGQFDIVWKTKEWVPPEPWSELTYPGVPATGVETARGRSTWSTASVPDRLKAVGILPRWADMRIPSPLACEGWVRAP